MNDYHIKIIMGIEKNKIQSLSLWLYLSFASKTRQKKYSN